MVEAPMWSVRLDIPLTGHLTSRPELKELRIFLVLLVHWQKQPTDVAGYVIVD